VSVFKSSLSPAAYPLLCNFFLCSSLFRLIVNYRSLILNCHVSGGNKVKFEHNTMKEQRHKKLASIIRMIIKVFWIGSFRQNYLLCKFGSSKLKQCL
jgi:hypothetical protein